MKYKKTKIALITIASLVVITRLALPYVIEDRINKVIAGNPEITGGVDDVDLWLLSGRASVDNLIINKAAGNIPTPIVSVDTLAFSISWKDLFRGSLLGDIELTKPILNIVDGKRQEDTQTGAEVDWRKALTSFYPFEINRISVNQGEVHFRNFESEPPVDLYLESIEAQIDNITNKVEIEDSRAAEISITAVTIGGGEVNLNSSFNLLRQPAKGQLEVSVDKLNLSALNDFARAYANLDIQSGVFKLDGQLRAQESEETGDIDGSFTPTVTKLNVLRWQDDAERQGDPGIILAWEGAVDAVTWLLEVGPKDKMTTEIPIGGSIENPDIGVAAGIWGLVKNALFGRFTKTDQENETQETENKE